MITIGSISFRSTVALALAILSLDNGPRGANAQETYINSRTSIWNIGYNESCSTFDGSTGVTPLPKDGVATTSIHMTTTMPNVVYITARTTTIETLTTTLASALRPIYWQNATTQTTTVGTLTRPATATVATTLCTNSVKPVTTVTVYTGTHQPIAYCL
ncbi:hypothetical protein B0T17DRAFT_620008 [Bombardia bombarda]|uniref:Uncharacterized protein n=1 Tax=Bombardia bombarda TaxID=252184 RepID=A0AA39WGZ3_9PEZI|nr:hypothetical protein B0T17DRAFT_620008 [Bombardia bombarda]